MVYCSRDCQDTDALLRSGNEIGPFRAIEESTLAHLTPAAIRSDIFAWYSLIGAAGAACGMLTCGWVTHHLLSEGWSTIAAYRVVFFAYAAIGVIKFALACGLSKKVEAEKRRVMPQRDAETAPLLGNGNAEEPKKRSWVSLVPSISKESRVIVVNLCLLFALDSFASGLAPLYAYLVPFPSPFCLSL